MASDEMIRQEDDGLPPMAPTMTRIDDNGKRRRKLPAFLDHFSARDLKVLFRCWVAAWVASIFMFIRPILTNIGPATFFASLVLLILPPAGIVFIHVLGYLSLFIGICLAWGWGSIVMKAALAARSAAETQAQLAALQQAAAQQASDTGISPNDAAQRLIYDGFMLDTRVSVVACCLSCVFIYFMARLRASNPKLALTQLFATIVIDLYLLFTPVLPSFRGTLPLSIVKPAAIGVGLGVVCSILFFPRSTSHVVLDSVEDLLELLSVPLHFTSSTLGGSKDDNSEISRRLSKTKSKLIEEYRKMEPAIAFLPLDFSIGCWGPNEVKQVTEGVKQVMASILSLLDFHTSRISGEAFIVRALQKYTDNANDSDSSIDEKKHEIGSQQLLQLGEMMKGLQCPDDQPVREETLQQLASTSASAIAACLEGLDAAKDCIRMVNRRRWYWRPSAAEREHLSRRCQEALSVLRKTRPSFVHDTTEALLYDYLPRLSSEEDPDISHATVAGRLRGLVVGMVFEEHLASTMDKTEALLNLVAKAFDQSPKVRLWAPTGLRKAGSWAFGKNSKVPDMAPSCEDDPEDVLEDRTKAAKERLRISRGHYTPRQSKLGRAIIGTFRWLTCNDGLYALRMVVVTIAVSIPGLLPQTSGFYYREKGIWALIMAQTGLVLYMADFTFSVISRVIGTVIGGVLGLAAWYIGSGTGPGNPYGLSAVMAVVLIILLWVRLYLPPHLLQGGIMGGATFVLVVGYSYDDHHIPQYGSIGVGYNVFWRRLVLVLVGIAAATVVELFPRPPSAARHISKSLSHSLRTLSDHYALLLSCWGQPSEDGGLIAETISLKLNESLLMLEDLINLLRFEFSSSKFDSESLDLVKNLCQGMNRNLGRLLSLSGTLPLEYQDRLARLIGILDHRTIGEIMAVLGICEQALKTGDPLPEILPAPLVKRSFEYWQQHHPVIDLAHDPDLIRNEDYRRFCLALSAYLKFLGNIDELVLVLKGVLGETHLVTMNIV